MADVLSDEQVAAQLQGLEWKHEGEHIVRDWTFGNFAEAMAFVNRVAEAAEEANHHPDILLHGWNKVPGIGPEGHAGGDLAVLGALGCDAHE
jgi:pterin-4a-carbinolamine dehydratase